MKEPHYVCDRKDAIAASGIVAEFWPSPWSISRAEISQPVLDHLHSANSRAIANPIARAQSKWQPPGRLSPQSLCG